MLRCGKSNRAFAGLPRRRDGRRAALKWADKYTAPPRK
jgi:hypothetical protein